MTQQTFEKTTDRIVVIDWAGYRDKSNRKKKWGGHIGAWGVDKLDDGVYRIPHSVNIAEIDEALNDVIRDSDQAVLTYPHGSTDRGSSAMCVRIYGKHATD